MSHPAIHAADGWAGPQERVVHVRAPLVLLAGQHLPLLLLRVTLWAHRLVLHTLLYSYKIVYYNVQLQVLLLLLLLRRAYLVDPPLVEKDAEDDVVAEARHAVQRRHADDEGEEVVDEGVECL